jgi:hypothetical protein
MRKRQLSGILYFAGFGSPGCMYDSTIVCASASERKSSIEDENERYEDCDTSYGGWELSESTIGEVCHDNGIDLTADVLAHVTTKADFITWLYDNGYME